MDTKLPENNFNDLKSYKNFPYGKVYSYTRQSPYYALRKVHIGVGAAIACGAATLLSMRASRFAGAAGATLTVGTVLQLELGAIG